MTAPLASPADQLGLFDDHPPELVRIAGDAHESIAARFEAFHEANPWVYDALVRLARDLRARRAGRVGIGMLFEVLRWQYLRATSGDEFKLNNDYRSRYARLIMSREPDLADVFEIRKLRTA